MVNCRDTKTSLNVILTLNLTVKLRPYEKIPLLNAPGSLELNERTNDVKYSPLC
jgi:hypothetical protein